MNSDTKFPPGSIMSEMHFEMHASTVRDQITMLHGKKFESELDHIKLFYQDKQLLFIFKNGGEKNLGGYVNDRLLSYFRKVDDVSIFQIDPETKEPINGQIIPLTIIDE